MKSTVKKIFSLLLVLLIAGSGLGALSANAVTAYEILDKLAVLDANGSTWGSYGNLKPGSSFTNGQCWQYVKGVSSYVYGTTVSIPNTASYLGGGSLGEYYRVRAALTNCTYDQIVELLKLSQPGDVIGFKNSKVDSTYGHIMFIGNNTGKKITFYQAASGKARKDTVDLTVAGLKSLYSFGYSGSASFASSSYGISLFRCNRRTGQSDWVYTDEPTTPPGPQTPPTNAWAQASTTMAKVGEPITFTYGAQGAVSYAFNYFINGKLTTIDVGYDTQYSFTFNSPGTYTTHITNYNSYGLTDSQDIVIYIYNSTPTNAWAEASATTVQVGEPVTFTYGAQGAISYAFNYFINGKLTTIDVGYDTQYSFTFNSPGTYTTHITNYNSYGLTDSQDIVIYVYDKPINAWAKANKTTVQVGEPVTFTYGAQGAYSQAFNYFINGNLTTIFIGFGTQQYSYSFESPGTYTTHITNYNDYGLTDSQDIVINVYDPNATYSVSFNANGGTGAPASQTKNYAQALTLTTEIPTRGGYTFTGWNTQADGKGTSYVPGASYTAEADVTLYAQWQKNEVTLQSIAVKTNPTQTTYTVGETLNTAGLTLTAAYSDGSTQTVTSGFTCNPTKLDTAGFRTITVTYNGKTATFGVTVNLAPATLTGIAVKTPPAQMIYTVGDTLNTAGLTLTAAYSDGSTQTVTSGFTCNPTKLNIAGQQTITVTYGGKTASFVVTVNSAAPTQGRVRAVSVSDVSINYKAKTTLKPQITADDGVKYTVSYSSSNPNVVKVNEKTGEVTGAKKGTATVTCAVTDEFGNTVSDACKVTVNYTALQWVIRILLFGWIWYK